MSRAYHSPGSIFAALVVATLAYADEDQFAKWAKVEFEFHGPTSLGRGEPNPFAVKLDVDFCAPDGSHYRVPGFYDGDGRGGLDGDVWKVRFAADKIGLWTYTTVSDNDQLHGKTGRFAVSEVPASAEGFWRWGRLEAVGTADNLIRYLRFRDGPYWLKAGCDDPENFLGRYYPGNKDHQPRMTRITRMGGEEESRATGRAAASPLRLSA